jgi:peptidoglycan/LPS O-acetylase OafA/YrhL
MATGTAPALAATRLRATPSRFYRPELDALRFLAFLSVFVCHTIVDCQQPYISQRLPSSPLLATVGRAGSFGVDLFFLLSAYLITELLLREKEETGVLHVRSFYLRRILRIWPLYFFFIALAWSLTRFVKGQSLPPSYVIAFLLLAGNWICAIRGLPNSVVYPLWSVSLEEQFYLLWPLVVRKASRRGIATTAVVMIVVSTLSRFLFLHLDWTDGLWKNSLTRLEPIALGVLVAIVFRGRALRIPGLCRALMFCAGILLWMITARFCDLEHSVGGAMVGYPGIAMGSLVIFLSVFGWQHGPLRNQWLVHLGKVSYGLYVYHLLGLGIASRVLYGRTSRPVGFSTFWLLGLIVTIAFSLASYEWLEKPFLRLKQKYTLVLSRPD